MNMYCMFLGHVIRYTMAYVSGVATAVIDGRLELRNPRDF